MKYKVILLDFDGTMFDTRENIAEMINMVRRDFNLEDLSLETIVSYVGHGLKNLVTRAFEGTEVDIKEAFLKAEKNYVAYPTLKVKPYPGVFETLEKCPQKLGIISNKPKEVIELVLNHFGKLELFDFIIGGECMPKRKPDPMAVDLMQEKLRVEKEEMIMVGDFDPDIEIAKRAGIASIFCKYGFSGVDRVGADHAVENFSEILNYV